MSKQNIIRPLVGIGLFLVKDNKEILLAKRTSSHGTGQYAGIGGHLENGESFEECIKRELSEEAGDDLIISNLRFLCLTNITKYRPNHYVDIGMTADYVSGKTQVMEADKIDTWDWYSIDELPAPLFGSTQKYVEAYKNKHPYFE